MSKLVFKEEWRDDDGPNHPSLDRPNSTTDGAKQITRPTNAARKVPSNAPELQMD